MSTCFNFKINRWIHENVHFDIPTSLIPRMYIQCTHECSLNMYLIYMECTCVHLWNIVFHVHIGDNCIFIGYSYDIHNSFYVYPRNMFYALMYIHGMCMEYPGAMWVYTNNH